MATAHEPVMGCFLFIVSKCGKKKKHTHFYFVMVHCVAYSIKQSRTINPILSVCVGEIKKAQQDKILNGI